MKSSKTKEKKQVLSKKLSPLQLSVFVLGFVIIFYNLYLCATAVLHGDVGFNTDLARDFLLLEDVIKNHTVPLIGPRSGGIPGVFHGPLWLYLNLPAFLLGKGDPVVVGWFWVGLVGLLTGLVAFVGSKLYGRTVGLLSAILMSAVSVGTTSSLFNPFGAVLVFPVYFYFLHQYLTEKKIWILVLALFCGGLLIQFQVAFGMPILILSTLLIFYTIFKQKLLTHLTAFLVLLLPLSTYIVFDLRHDFLETKAMLTYLSGKSGAVDNFTPHAMLMNRVEGFINTLATIPSPNTLLTILILTFFTFLLYKGIKNKTTTQGKSTLLFFYLFFGYWIFAFIFKGVIWNYYTWPFLPLTVLLISSGWKVIPKYLFIIFYAVILLSTWQQGFSYKEMLTKHYIGKDSGSWLFNYELAQTVYAQKDSSFGYYIFSPDQYGYSPRYAMNYLSSQQPDIQVFPYHKQPITYLLISPPGGKNNSIGGQWWKLHKVNISKKPEKTITFANGFKVEKYLLTDKERATPTDPNLIDSLIFR